MFSECKKIENEIIAMRRDLHRIPEIHFDLPETSAYVMKKLDEYGIEYKFFDDICGIVARINPGKGRCVALRTDMDGLMINEGTGLPYDSQHKGRMHACGHDAHMAMLLGASRVLAAHKDQLAGEVRLIFQPFEEGVKGAAAMIERGAMDGVDAVFGMHIGTLLGTHIPSGSLVVMPGANMASADVIHINVRGKGCHASTPDRGIDPISIAAHIVIGLQEIIAREINAVDPAVITFGSINGGTQHNIIPDSVSIAGTARTYDNNVRSFIEKRVGEIASSIAAAYGGSVEYEYRRGSAPVINDPELTAFAAENAKELLGEENVIEHEKAVMVGEDFSAYQQLAPGVFMQLSTADASKGTACSHHTATFNIDEDQLWKGSALFVKLASAYLSQHK